MLHVQAFVSCSLQLSFSSASGWKDWWTDCSQSRTPLPVWLLTRHSDHITQRQCFVGYGYQYASASTSINQSINQTNNFTWPEYRNYTARSTGDSQVMYSKYSGKDFLNRCVLRRRQNVVNDAADVTSSGRSFHVCGPVTTTRKARLPTVDSLLVGTIQGDWWRQDAAIVDYG